MKKKDEKTNVLRLLEQRGIACALRTYPHGDEAVDGAEVARLLGQDPEQVYKTLVARGASGQHYVFDIPVCAELDLKKAARAVGEKSIAMIHVKELLPLTGYVRGGCSPIGMKKPFPTVIQEDAQLYDTIAVSAGKIGAQVVLSPADLAEMTGAGFADVIK